MLKILIGIILYALFFAMCYIGTGTDKKNMKSFYSYPDEIQNKLMKNERFAPMIPKRVSQGMVFFSNVILFTIIFCVIGLLLPEDDFAGIFSYILLLGQGLNLFDLLVIDLLWWRNTGRTKFEGLAAEEELYHNPQKHIAAFLRGIPMFLCSAAVSATLLNLIKFFNK